MKRIFVAIVFFSSFSYGADVCNYIDNSIQVGLCADNKKNEADKYLNEQYSNLMGKIKKEYINDVGLRDELITSVKASQRNWIKFRDSNCKLYSFQIDSNSPAYQTTINECIARMSESRGRELALISNDM